MSHNFIKICSSWTVPLQECNSNWQARDKRMSWHDRIYLVRIRELCLLGVCILVNAFATHFMRNRLVNIFSREGHSLHVPLSASAAMWNTQCFRSFYSLESLVSAVSPIALRATVLAYIFLHDCFYNIQETKNRRSSFETFETKVSHRNFPFEQKDFIENILVFYLWIMLGFNGSYRYMMFLTFNFYCFSPSRHQVPIKP